MASINNIQNEYTPLYVAPKQRSTQASSLYLAPNHLLILQLRGTTEYARRFYYKDITAIRCATTRRGGLTDAAVLFGILLLWYLASTWQEPVANFFAIIATVVAVIALGANVARGPSCVIWLHTANHNERLTVPRRYRPARRVLAQLEERIRAAQATIALNPEAGPLVFTPYKPPAPPRPPRYAGKYTSQRLTSLFYGAAAVAFIAAIHTLYPAPVILLAAISLLLVLACIGPAIVTETFQADCPPAARRSALVFIGYLALAPPAGVVAAVVRAFLYNIPTSSVLFTGAQPFSPLPNAFWFGWNTVMFIAGAGCSYVGLRALHRHRKSVPARAEAT